jgi:hypothetical protein
VRALAAWLEGEGADASAEAGGARGAARQAVLGRLAPRRPRDARTTDDRHPHGTHG